MYCPRIDHFVRLNSDGTIGKCGHMIGAKGFENFNELDKSDWLGGLRQHMKNEKWPDECTRCRQSEEEGEKSIRQNSIDRHNILKKIKQDYIVVGGVLDNVCNSACQTCSATLSTKIGSLQTKKYPKTNNYDKFWTLPQDRILELDVSGGEPTASKNYKRLLVNLPEQIKIVRMNTNGSKKIKEIEEVLAKDTKLIVTMSLDGIGKTHDYVRWPIKWEKFKETLESYQELQERHKNLYIDTWTTVSCLNVANLPDIIKFTKERGLQHNWAFLDQPYVYNVKYRNVFTLQAKDMFPDQVATDKDNSDDLVNYLKKQDRLRGVDIRDYFNLPPNFNRNR